MPWALPLSLALHVAVILLAMVGLPWRAPPPLEQASVQVRIISASDLAQRQADSAAPPIPTPVIAPPRTATPTAPTAPAAPDPGPVPLSLPTPPRAAERIAPEPQPTPPAALPEGAVLIPPRRETPAPDPSPEPAPEPPQAPQEAAPENVPDPEPQEIEQTPVPATAPRPAPRPTPPVIADQTPPEPVATPEPTPEPSLAQEPTPAAEPVDPIAAAIAEAVAGAAQPPQPGAASGALSGPQLSQGDRDALRLAVSQCWNFSGLSVEARQITVTLAFDMEPSGLPVAASIRRISDSGGSEAAVRNATDVARRALLLCQRSGYPLPPEKYAQWRQIEMTFNPERMRQR